MHLTDFKVLTFDVVGTLIDFETGVLSAFRALGGTMAESLDDDAIYAAYMKGREAHWERSSEVMREVYRHAAALLGFPDEPQHAEAFQASVLGWQPFADAAEALGRLRRHYRLVAMTNADRVALSAYAHRLGNPFHDTVCVDETGRPKPDPMFFHYNLGRQSAFGFQQAEILHTAQSQYHDIGVAHALGYATCWIERRQGLKGYGATPDPASFTTPNFPFGCMRDFADAADAAFRVKT